MPLKIQSPLDKNYNGMPNPTSPFVSFDGLVTTNDELYRTFVKNKKWDSNNLRIHLFNLNIFHKLDEIIYHR